MKNYKDKECESQQSLIHTSGLFNGTLGGGRFIGNCLLYTSDAADD